MVNFFSKILFIESANPLKAPSIKLSSLGSLICSLLIIIVVIWLDLFTKNQVYFLLHNSFEGNDLLQRDLLQRQIKITSFFSLVYVNNNGISFGMFNDIKNAKEVFSILQGSIALSLLVWLWRAKNLHISIALALIIGGAFGNVFDRIQNGGVTDFLDFHLASYHWPAFNLADSVIFIGVAIILFDEFIFKKSNEN